MSVIGVVSRLCNFLTVLYLFLSEVKFVGFVKCSLNALAISWYVVARLVLNFIDRLRSVVVGSLLFSDFMVVQYVF